MDMPRRLGAEFFGLADAPRKIARPHFPNWRSSYHSQFGSRTVGLWLPQYRRLKSRRRRDGPTCRTNISAAPISFPIWWRPSKATPRRKKSVLTAVKMPTCYNTGCDRSGRG
jgi:hypothetical protein